MIKLHLPLGDPIAITRKPARAAVSKQDRVRPRLAKGLQISAVDAGYIVYDHANERVHYLNHTAGLVMDLCTGRNTWNQIVDLVKRAFGLPRKPTREVGRLLQQLGREGLVSLDR